MANVTKILRFANTFENLTSLENMLWDGAPPTIVDAPNPLAPVQPQPELVPDIAPSPNPMPWEVQPSQAPVLSQRTMSIINSLAPEFRPQVQAMMLEGLRQGLKPELSEGKRSQDRQNALYEQGRTTPGQVVTWTRSSMHTRGLAVDVVQLDDKGNITWNATPGFWDAMARIGKSQGMKWGGDFKTPDRPHFQYNQNVPTIH